LNFVLRICFGFRASSFGFIASPSHGTRSVPATLGQHGLAHQVAVAFAGGAAAFVDGPDDQALAATHVARREHAGDAGGVLAVLGPGVAARVAFDAELGEQLVFGAEEAHGQEHELGGEDLLAAGDFAHRELAAP
jgi:hypothetical protein